MKTMNENKPDLVIHGSVNASGGVYNKVDVQGFGKIKGDVECETLHCAGHLSITGNVRGASAKVEGNASISGKAELDTIEVYGQLDVNGDLAFTRLKVDGNTKIHGSMTGEEVKVRGMLKTTGDCEAEVFSAKGAFTVGGLLNAGRIEVHLHGGCEAKEMGGEYIEVRKAGSSTLNKLLKHIFNSALALSVDSVEGDEIYLEYTRAKVVRGKNVEIGPGCEIDLVESSEDFRLDPGSLVKQHVKR
ncbi:polymer-forming cytoskeletal protein [Brevibacillus parabrevis]|nr:polymer-forming cytoskeletal protein [Brevibacillus parabrevis]NRQ53321.1 polymer-forming cytoskeletal protein [Brevibacillus sp. HD1.4A]